LLFLLLINESVVLLTSHPLHSFGRFFNGTKRFLERAEGLIIWPLRVVPPAASNRLEQRFVPFFKRPKDTMYLRNLRNQGASLVGKINNF
jgi:hypothetical protein